MVGMAFENIAQELLVYDPPKEIVYTMHNDDYTVKVRIPGGEWRDLYEYKVMVDMDRVQEASVVHFDFSGTVEVMVKKNDGIVNEVKVRPSSSRVVPVVHGNTILFTINRPLKLSLEINGDRMHNLHVFARKLDNTVIDTSDPSVMYFGPGVHDPKEMGAYKIPSGKTVYLHGSAIVKAKLLIDSAANVKILGSGIVLQTQRGIEITNSRNVLIDGIIFINPDHYTIFGGASNELTIRNIMSFSCKGWSDGIDLMSCSEVLIDNVFMRNSDDCIAIYAHRWKYFGNARNYKISNSILWADVAHPTNIGIHGNANHAGDTIENISFSSLDILEHDEDDRNYQGCMAITCSDNNLVRNITYENIRIDNIQEGQLLNFSVVYNEKYSAAPGRGIQNVQLTNISYTGDPVNPSVIRGYDEKRKVQGVTIRNLWINNKLVRDPKQANVHVGEFCDPLIIRD
jgi:hypothetical protein